VATLQALPQCIQQPCPFFPFLDKLQSMTPNLHTEELPEVYSSNSRRCHVINADGSPGFSCRISCFDGLVWLPSVPTHKTTNPVMTVALPIQSNESVIWLGEVRLG